MQNENTQQHGTINEQIIETVASWPHITAGEGRFNATSFELVGSWSIAGMPREIGHLHPRLADIGYPEALRDQLITDGHTEKHHAVPRHPNATTFHIESADDIDHVVWLFRLSYLARVSTLQKHKETEVKLKDIDVQEELDTLAPSDAVRHAFETAVGDDS